MMFSTWITTLCLAASIRSDAPAATPFRQPQLAVVRDGAVVMTFGGGPAIYFASSKDGGQTFGNPVKITETGALALGRHRGPRIVALREALVVTAISGDRVATGAHAHGLPEAGNLVAWRSTDQGRTWTRASVVNDIPGAAREGLHAMVPLAGGSGLFAVWLDLREKGTRLYGAKSTDGGLTWSKNVPVYESPDGTICQCCHPSLAVDTSGAIRVMWRNVMDGSRDMFVAVSTDGGAHFSQNRKLGDGTWKLNACPMDGGGFVVVDGKITSAWRRENTIYLSEEGAPERAVGSGKDVAIVRTGKGPYLAWTREGNVVALSPGDKEPVIIGKDGGFATLLAMPDGSVLAAWESQGAIETRVLR